MYTGEGKKEERKEKKKMYTRACTNEKRVPLEDDDNGDNDDDDDYSPSFSRTPYFSISLSRFLSESLCHRCRDTYGRQPSFCGRANLAYTCRV
jgi:hypothetical protein